MTTFYKDANSILYVADSGNRYDVPASAVEIGAEDAEMILDSPDTQRGNRDKLLNKLVNDKGANSGFVVKLQQRDVIMRKGRTTPEIGKIP